MVLSFLDPVPCHKVCYTRALVARHSTWFDSLRDGLASVARQGADLTDPSCEDAFATLMQALRLDSLLAGRPFSLMTLPNPDDPSQHCN